MALYKIAKSDMSPIYVQSTPAETRDAFLENMKSLYEQEISNYDGLKVENWIFPIDPETKMLTLFKNDTVKNSRRLTKTPIGAAPIYIFRFYTYMVNMGLATDYDWDKAQSDQYKNYGVFK